jgi:subtilisin-like proprotein convertase family protein
MVGNRDRVGSSRRVWMVAVGAAALCTAGLMPVAASARPTSAAASTDDLSPTVQQQIAAVLADKASRTPAEQKVDSNLLYAAQARSDGTAVDGAPSMKSTVAADKQGEVAVDIDAKVSQALLDEIKSLGGTVVAAVPGFDAVRARLPLAKVVTLAGDSTVKAIAPAGFAQTQKADPPPKQASDGGAATSSVGAGDSEADTTLNAVGARSTFGVDGTGVKVCVLSDGVNTLAARQASGDLPPTVDVLSGQAGNGDEGTAMLELIHDIAPGSPLGFATAFTSQASFAQNIINLQAAGCKVIVDDVNYFAERTFQNSNVAQAIETVKAAGSIYFTAATNSGNLQDGTSGTWQGDFSDGGLAAAPLPNATYHVHQWAAGNTQNVITKTGGQINLEWADPTLASTNDYDLFLLNSAGSGLVSSSTNIQNGTQNPQEAVGTSPVGDRIVVAKAPTAAARYLAVYTNRGTTTVNTGGSARGHNGSVDAVSVSAVPAHLPFGTGPAGPYPGQHTTASLSEPFTSDGPIRRYFQDNGTAITPGNFGSTGGQGINGPDITSADGAATTTPGFIPFYGTSAAAPDAAALAALALQAKPALTPTQLETAMKGSALDIESAGVDVVAGNGITMAPALMSTIGATPKANLDAGTLTKVINPGDGDGLVEPGETVSITQALVNHGGAAATGISATLTNTNGDATVLTPTVNYPNLAAGASSLPSNGPLKFRVARTCPCGKALKFNLTVNYSGGPAPSEVIPLTVVTGQPGPITVVPVSGVFPIPDNSATGVSPTAAVGAIGPINNLTFSIDGSACNTDVASTTVGIDHSWVGDLTGTLMSPQGTTITLFSRVGGVNNSANNFCQTVFSDTAAQGIQEQTSAGAPYTGTFRPTQALSAFNGEDPHGTWTFKVADSVSTDTGTVRAFSLHIQTATCDIFNSTPVAANDSATATSGTPLNVSAPGVLSNDTDADGDALTAAKLTNPAHGTATVNSNGSWTYTSVGGYSGPDSFTYRDNDGVANSNTATVNVTVNPVVANHAPVANTDSYTAFLNTTLNVSAANGVLKNDTDADSDPLTAAKTTNPGHGTVTLNSDGSLTYVPTTGYFGPDSFTYKANDGTANSAAATVNINVDRLPVSANDSYRVLRNTVFTKAAPGVLANDSDPDGNAIAAAKVTNPAHGTVTVNTNGSFTYAPTSGYAGTDSFTYHASDGKGFGNTATVSLLVQTPTQAYVEQGYLDFIGRLADAGGLQFWSSRIDSGTETRRTFIKKMTRSHEYAVKVVTKAYMDVLGRGTDPSGREFWARKVVAGMPISTLTLNLMGSHEFLVKSGGTTTGFVNAAYQAILGRQPTTSERSAAVARLNAGTTQRQVALDLYNTVESRQRRVKNQFEFLLRREPTTADNNTWVPYLATKSDIELAITLGASDEYYAYAQNHAVS